MKRQQGWGQPHIDFAQALVQLARDHGVSCFDGSFRLDFDRENSGWSGDRITINWSVGRHGDDGKIGLKNEAYASVPEIAPNSASLPAMIYFEAPALFLHVGSRKPESAAFTARWIGRAADFPQSHEACMAGLNEDTRAYIIRRYPA